MWKKYVVGQWKAELTAFQDSSIVSKEQYSFLHEEFQQKCCLKESGLLLWEQKQDFTTSSCVKDPKSDNKKNSFYCSNFSSKQWKYLRINFLCILHQQQTFLWRVFLKCTMWKFYNCTYSQNCMTDLAIILQFLMNNSTVQKSQATPYFFILYSFKVVLNNSFPGLWQSFKVFFLKFFLLACSLPSSPVVVSGHFQKNVISCVFSQFIFTHPSIFYTRLIQLRL